MKTIWKYVMNTFLSVTSDSFRLTLRISQYHLGALQAHISIALVLIIVQQLFACT